MGKISIYIIKCIYEIRGESMNIKKLRQYLKKNKVVVLSVLLIASMFFGIYKSTKVYLYEKD